MLISSHMRYHELVMRKSKNDQRLRQLQIALDDLLAFGEHIADGKISLFEMTKVPSSMFNRQLIFNENARMYADDYANTCLLESTNSRAYNDYLNNHPEFEAGQALYEEQLRQNYYNEGLKQYRDYEREILHEQEGQLKAEKDSLSVENQALTAEMEGLQKERSEEIKRTFSTQA